MQRFTCEIWNKDFFSVLLWKDVLTPLFIIPVLNFIPSSDLVVSSHHLISRSLISDSIHLSSFQFPYQHIQLISLTSYFHLRNEYPVIKEESCNIAIVGKKEIFPLNLQLVENKDNFMDDNFVSSFHFTYSWKTIPRGLFAFLILSPSSSFLFLSFSFFFFSSHFHSTRTFR